MENLELKTFEDYQKIVNEFNRTEKILIDTAKIIEEEVLKYPLCQNHKLIPVFNDGNIELYFKEHSDALVVCSINIFDGEIKGILMDDKMIKYYLLNLTENRKVIQEQYDIIQSELDFKTKFKKLPKFLVKQEKIDTLVEMLEEFKMSKMYADTYIDYFKNRHEIIISITHEIWEMLNNSERLKFMKFSKQFEHFDAEE
jgi:hypothetical protein